MDSIYRKKSIFKEILYPLQIIRYHFLAVKGDTLRGLRISAIADNGIIMAVRHKEYPVEGVHPRMKPHRM